MYHAGGESSRPDKPVNPHLSPLGRCAQDKPYFADGYPFMLMTRPSIENLNGKLSGRDTAREMENIRRGPIFGDLSLSAPRRRCRISKLQGYRVQKYRLPSPPSFKCNVLCESLSVDSHIIPCAKLKRRGSWAISYTSGYSTVVN